MRTYCIMYQSPYPAGQAPASGSSQEDLFFLSTLDTPIFYTKLYSKLGSHHFLLRERSLSHCPKAERLQCEA